MVSVSVPCTGFASRMMPAAIASTAEISDHQKPGISRAQNVSIRPAMPEIRNIQPRKMVTARLASGGTIMAASPRIMSRMPSIKKAFQCSRTAARISDCSLVVSWGRVMENLLMRATQDHAPLWRPNMTFANAADSNLFTERRLATAGRGGKALGSRAHPITAKDIDRRGGQEERASDQKGDEADRNENERRVTIRVCQPVLDRCQHKGQTRKSSAAAEYQQCPHPSQLAQPLACDFGAGRVMTADPPHQAHRKPNGAKPDQYARRSQD